MVEKYTVSVINSMEQNRNTRGIMQGMNNKKNPGFCYLDKLTTIDCGWVVRDINAHGMEDCKK